MSHGLNTFLADAVNRDWAFLYMKKLVDFGALSTIWDIEKSYLDECILENS